MLKSRIPQITIQLELTIQDAVQQGADKIERAAKEKVPYLTGALYHAIHVEDKGRGYKPESYVVAGDDEAFYGHIVEYGSVRSSPRPFLIPAFEENREDILEDARERLRRL